MAALRKVLPGRMGVADFLAWDGGDHSGRSWNLRLDSTTLNSTTFELPLADIYRTALVG